MICARTAPTAGPVPQCCRGGRAERAARSGSENENFHPGPLHPDHARAEGAPHTQRGEVRSCIFCLLAQQQRAGRPGTRGIGSRSALLRSARRLPSDSAGSLGTPAGGSLRRERVLDAASAATASRTDPSVRCRPFQQITRSGGSGHEHFCSRQSARGVAREVGLGATGRRADCRTDRGAAGAVGGRWLSARAWSNQRRGGGASRAHDVEPLWAQP
jgi:hypothetical protein